MTASAAESGHRILFLAGLHRSGTSALYRALGTHAGISCFTGTGVPEDEGQFLQPLYPPALAYGGPGRFGFRQEMHLTESSELLTPMARQQVFAAWSKHWNLSKTVLAEKSPPNLIKSRFLQALFPEAAFVFLTRHPVPVALATSKWSGGSLTALIEHWIACHCRMQADLPYLRRALVLCYEDLVADPATTLGRILELVGLPSGCESDGLAGTHNDRYFRAWAALRRDQGQVNLAVPVPGGGDKIPLVLKIGAEIQDIETRFEAEIKNFGYSFADCGDER